MAEFILEVSDALDALVGDVTLLDIRFFEIHAERLEEEEDAGWHEAAGPDDESREEVNASHSMSFSRRQDGTAFRISLRTTLRVREGMAFVRCVAEYGVSSPNTHELNDELLLDFANHMGTMTLLPYVREGLAEVTQRVLGAGLLMPIIRRGELVFTPDSSAK